MAILQDNAHIAINRAMILAAGLGTRMQSLTAQRPKPLVEVGGTALIDHVLARAVQAGIAHVVVNLHYFADMLQSHLERKSTPQISFSDERSGLLDTGGGVKKALPLLGDSAFFILNTDSIWLEEQPPNLIRLRQAWDGSRMDCLLLLAARRGALGYDGPGDFHLAASGRVRRRDSGEVADYAHTGICIIHPRLFQDSPETPFSLNLLWDRAMHAGRLFALPMQGRWMHVGTPDAVARAGQILRKGGK